MRTWIIAAVVVAVLALGVTAYALLKPSPFTGDATKLGVTLSPENQRRADTVIVTRSQLNEATCDDGHHCYIAVNGIVYDLSGHKTWAKGRHHGIKAGGDATAAFVDSPHAGAKLLDLTVVGRLAD